MQYIVYYYAVYYYAVFYYADIIMQYIVYYNIVYYYAVYVLNFHWLYPMIYQRTDALIRSNLCQACQLPFWSRIAYEFQ